MKINGNFSRKVFSLRAIDSNLILAFRLSKQKLLSQLSSEDQKAATMLLAQCPRGLHVPFNELLLLLRHRTGKRKHFLL